MVWAAAANNDRLIGAEQRTLGGKWVMSHSPVAGMMGWFGPTAQCALLLLGTAVVAAPDLDLSPWFLFHDGLSTEALHFVFVFVFVFLCFLCLCVRVFVGPGCASSH